MCGLNCMWAYGVLVPLSGMKPGSLALQARFFFFFFPVLFIYFTLQYCIGFAIQARFLTNGPPRKSLPLLLRSHLGSQMEGTVGNYQQEFYFFSFKQK